MDITTANFIIWIYQPVPVAQGLVIIMWAGSLLLYGKYIEGRLHGKED